MRARALARVPALSTSRRDQRVRGRAGEVPRLAAGEIRALLRRARAGAPARLAALPAPDPASGFCSRFGCRGAPERLGAIVEGFVDVHSHAIPSGDDGARSIEEVVELCGLALTGGTHVLFATPHAHAEWDHYPPTLERQRLFNEVFTVVSQAVAPWGLD